MFTNDVTPETIDEMEMRLVALESAIARCRLEQARLLNRLSARNVPRMDGARNLAEWTAGRLDVGAETARSLTGAARFVSRQPQFAEAITDGHASYDRATATARLRERGATPDQIAASEGLDIAAVRRQAARRRLLRPTAEHEAFRDRHLTIQPSLDESRWRIWGELPGFEGAVVDKALTQRADEMPALPDGSRPDRGQRHADALVSIAQDSLDGGAGSDAAGTPIATVFVDASTAAPSQGRRGCTMAAGPRVGPETLERILCGGRVEVTALTETGEPLSVGRTTRAVSPRLRRFVLHRDGGCAVEGCTSRYRLQAHHKVPYSEGGRTDADNLVTLCWFHHHVVVHGYGYRIDPESPSGRIRFIRRSGADPPG